MGCLQSSPDPNDLYGGTHENIKIHESKQKKTKKDNKIHPVRVNGSATENGKTHTDVQFLGGTARQKTLKGDAFTYGEAKLSRERRLRENLLKREQMAKDMSDRVMEEKERLSLTSGRSRNTSRATSPRSSRYTTRNIEISMMSFQAMSPRNEDKIDEETDHYHKGAPGTSKDTAMTLDIPKTDTDTDSRKYDMDNEADLQQSEAEITAKEENQEPVSKKGKKNKKGGGIEKKSKKASTDEDIKGEDKGAKSQQSAVDNSSMDESLVVTSGLGEEPGVTGATEVKQDEENGNA